MRIDIDFTGIEETQKRLKNMAKNINSESGEVLKDVGELGWQFAFNLAPEWSGALKDAIINFPENKEIWVIQSSRPVGDAIPVNIMFDEGTYPNPRNPNSIHFMKQTAEFLETEFSQRLNLAIERVIQNE